MIDRLVSNLWQPLDERLLLPRRAGLGWDLNFGALAVRLGLIEPDAEDVPFSNTPRAAVAAAAAFPVAMTGAVVAHYAVRGASLPEKLPAHWSWNGTPDRFTSKGLAAACDLAATAIPAALALFTLVKRPQPDAAAASGLAAGLSAAGATMCVVRSMEPVRRWWVGPALVGSVLAGTGGVLTGLALLGRRGEIARDLR